VLLECKPLLILAAALACFHLGNGAMLPLYGLAVVAAKQGDPASFVAMTIVVAQGVMIVASLVAMRMAEKRGYWLVLLISFLALPIRGLIAAYLISRMGRLSGADARRHRRRPAERRGPGPRRAHPERHRPGQCRPGRGHDRPGSRRSLSPAIGGWIAQAIGYSAMFMILGSFASARSRCGSLSNAPLLRPACARAARPPCARRGARITITDVA
jgi:hypothetical protein